MVTAKCYCGHFLQRDCFFSQAPQHIQMDGSKGFLPDDIIRDILKRVPVKSLIRFQSVAKDWKNLFQTPTFIADHLHHSNHNGPFLLLQRIHRNNPQFDSLSLCLLDCEMKVLWVQNTPLINSMSRARIVGSSNGLLCVRHSDGGSPDLLSLWNPATREVRQVPRTINDFKGVCYLGFGFSHIVNDYKIVRIYFSEFDDEDGVLVLNKICANRVEVYSLRTGLWKEIEFGNIQNVGLISEPVIANGAMFWLGLKMGAWEEDDRDLVVSFDIALEAFTLITMPASASKSNANKLTVYENKLAMFSHFVIGNFESSLIDLWVMESTCATGESWTKKYTIGPFSSMLYPLSIWRNEIVCKVEMSGFVGDGKCDGVKTVLSLFNPTTNELKNFPTHRHDHDYVIFNYAESLVPVGNIHLEE